MASRSYILYFENITILKRSTREAVQIHIFSRFSTNSRRIAEFSVIQKLCAQASAKYVSPNPCYLEVMGPVAIVLYSVLEM